MDARARGLKKPPSRRRTRKRELVGGGHPDRARDIWLILPVIICLSQRLSHACLSTSRLCGETADGSLNRL